MDAIEPPPVEVMPPKAPWEDLPEGDYCVAELMGHTVLVGRISEIERFGAKMAAIEVLFGGKLLPAIFQGGGSFYRLTPCSREVAWKRQHTETWSLPEAIKAIVPAALLPAPERDHDKLNEATMERCIASGDCKTPDDCRANRDCAIPF